KTSDPFSRRGVRVDIPGPPHRVEYFVIMPPKPTKDDERRNCVQSEPVVSPSADDGEAQVKSYGEYMSDAEIKNQDDYFKEQGVSVFNLSLKPNIMNKPNYEIKPKESDKSFSECQSNNADHAWTEALTRKMSNIKDFARLQSGMDPMHPDDPAKL